MLELGKGFLFEGRQKRFTFDGDSFFIDLVLYNRLLKCYVLIDLKIGRLTHQDIGQMQMYVNYYDRKIKSPEENSTLGIILCKEENKAVVEFTLPENNRSILAKEYKLYLPSKETLKNNWNTFLPYPVSIYEGRRLMKHLMLIACYLKSFHFAAMDFSLQPIFRHTLLQL